MRRSFLANWLIAFILACVWARADSIAPAATVARSPAANEHDALPEPIIWRQLAFSIPFKLNSGGAPEQQPTQVRLYASSNQGVQWDLAQSVSPQERKFMFRVAGDGEYWFLIRTVDRQGRVSPEIAGPPEMRVVVDTVPPRLELSATRGDAGEIKATWQAFDPLLNPDSFKLEYQTAAGQWRPVAMDRPKSGADRNTSTGALTWWPSDAPPMAVAVRAEISDRAGNVAVSQAKAIGNSAANTAATRSRIDSSIPAPLVDPPAPSEGDRSTPVAEAVNPARGSAMPWPSNQSTDILFGRNPIAIEGPAGGSPRTTDRSQFITSRADVGSRAGQISMNTEPSAAGPLDPFRLPPEKSKNIAGISTAERGGGLEFVNPPIRNQVSSGIENTDRSAIGERPRMVNSRSFEMDYEVDSVGPSGVAKVELWGTRDRGHTWTSFGIDPDNCSPIRVNVDGEGIYGFRIVVQSGSGLRGLAPRSGDQPELWVAVDLTPPTVHLIDAVPGNGSQGGEILIRWEATDTALATRPISLMFSDKPGGPWSTIAAGLENTGQYAWRPDNRVPERVYLRVEARDEAGNIGAFDATEPLALERIRPAGKIRGVRSLDTASGGRIYEMLYR